MYITNKTNKNASLCQWSLNLHKTFDEDPFCITFLSFATNGWLYVLEAVRTDQLSSPFCPDSAILLKSAPNALAPQCRLLGSSSESIRIAAPLIQVASLSETKEQDYYRCRPNAPMRVSSQVELRKRY